MGNAHNGVAKFLSTLEAFPTGSQFRQSVAKFTEKECTAKPSIVPIGLLVEIRQPSGGWCGAL